MDYIRIPSVDGWPHIADMEDHGTHVFWPFFAWRGTRWAGPTARPGCPFGWFWWSQRGLRLSIDLCAIWAPLIVAGCAISEAINVKRWIIELDDGKIYRKALYLMVKTMVSCRFSLKPIHWVKRLNGTEVLKIPASEGFKRVQPQSCWGGSVLVLACW